MSTAIKPTNDPGPRPVFKYQRGWHHNVPQELVILNQWVNWRFDFRDGSKNRPGKWTKVLFQPRKIFNEEKKRRAFKAAKSDDPKTWGEFSETYNFQLGSRGFLDGVGFVFSTDDSYCGVDFDNCLNDDKTAKEWARPYIDRLSGAYWDISPSGRGLKGFVRAKLPGTGTRKAGFGPDKDGAIEIYCEGRFFTVTGDVWGTTPDEIPDHTDAILAIYNEIKTKQAKTTKSKGKAAGGDQATLEEDGDSSQVDIDVKCYLDSLSDDELLSWARNSKNGAKFSTLYDDGDCSGYPSESEADGALLVLLAFWTGEDKARMTRLFGGSALGKRGKCADRPEYVAGSVASAISFPAGKVVEPHWDRVEADQEVRAHAAALANGNGFHNGNGAVLPGLQPPKKPKEEPLKIITNFDWAGKGEDRVKVARRVAQITAGLNLVNPGWPKRVGEQLFIEGKDGLPHYLDSADKLFAYFDSVASVNWSGHDGLMISAKRFYEHLRQHAPDFESIET